MENVPQGVSDYHDVDYNNEDGSHSERHGDDYHDGDYNNQDSSYSERDGDHYHDIDCNNQNNCKRKRSRILTSADGTTITETIRTTSNDDGDDHSVNYGNEANNEN